MEPAGGFDPWCPASHNHARTSSNGCCTTPSALRHEPSTTLPSLLRLMSLRTHHKTPPAPHQPRRRSYPLSTPDKLHGLSGTRSLQRTNLSTQKWLSTVANYVCAYDTFMPLLTVPSTIYLHWVFPTPVVCDLHRLHSKN